MLTFFDLSKPIQLCTDVNKQELHLFCSCNQLPENGGFPLAFSTESGYARQASCELWHGWSSIKCKKFLPELQYLYQISGFQFYHSEVQRHHNHVENAFLYIPVEEPQPEDQDVKRTGWAQQYISVLEPIVKMAKQKSTRM